MAAYDVAITNWHYDKRMSWIVGTVVKSTHEFWLKGGLGSGSLNQSRFKNPKQGDIVTTFIGTRVLLLKLDLTHVDETPTITTAARTITAHNYTTQMLNSLWYRSAPRYQPGDNPDED